MRERVRSKPTSWQRHWVGLLLAGLALTLWLVFDSHVDRFREANQKPSLSPAERGLVELGANLSYRDFVRLLNERSDLIAALDGDSTAIFRLLEAGLPSEKAACVANLDGCPTEARVTLLVFEAPADLTLTSESLPFSERAAPGAGMMRIFELEGQPTGTPIPLTLRFADRICTAWLSADAALGGILFKRYDEETIAVFVNGGDALDC